MTITGGKKEVTLEEKQIQMRERWSRIRRPKRDSFGRYRKTVDAIDILQHLADGKTLKEIASWYRVNFRTIWNRLKDERRRHSARNNLHLLAIVVADELVIPSQFRDRRA